MFHWCVGGSSEAVLTRVRSFAAHFDSASQLSDFSKFGIGSGRSSPDSLLESSVLPSGRRAEGLKVSSCGGGEPGGGWFGGGNGSVESLSGSEGW